MKRKFIIGTRGSRLALAQTRLLKERFLALYPEIELEERIIKTKGDRFLNLSLSNQLEKGLFTKEIEEQLLSGEIDMAVHSLKDLPVVSTIGTTIAAYLKRAHTEDLWLGNKPLAELPRGAVIGTSSRRRAYQILEHYPELEIKEIRGNVETRIAKLEAGEYDAILMARAGLDRLGINYREEQIIPEELIVPAPGQAAIAVHVREDDAELMALLAQIDDQATRTEVNFEREVLHALGGGCAMPLGCVCHKRGESYQVKVYYAREDASASIYKEDAFTQENRDEVLERLVGELKDI